MDSCRNCSHPGWVHVKTYYYSCGRKPRNNNDEFYSNEICPCKEFVPSDNLEYLEWCVEKRRVYETSKR
jgi:hypothetical protein